MELFEQLDTDKNARIIRNLCMLRTAIELNYGEDNSMQFAVLSAVTTGVIAALGSTVTTVTASSAVVATGTMIEAGCGLATAACNAVQDATESIF